ncbi:MAG: methyltransferase domain-containing protein [Cyclobacteriaceae bacterium]|nr:methyltransferase domain-containing protein [Cyclobacteriaceae bacterium]
MSPAFNADQRSKETEIMDDLTCSGPVVERTLKDLDIINRLLGGNAVTLTGLKEMMESRGSSGVPLRIADLGCGSGDLLRRLARYARKNSIPVQLFGIDANPSIAAYASRHCADYPEITIEAVDVLSDEFAARSYDIISGTLFFHHFDDDTLVRLLPRLVSQAKYGVLINDIHRHWFAYHSIKWLTRWFSSSPMVHYDAPLSVSRAFTRGDWKRLTARSGIVQYRISWHWAFRWKIMLCSPDSRLAQFW